MSKFCLSLLAAGLGLGQLASAGFDPTIQSNVAVYWGQNSYGQANSQLRLSEYCSSRSTSRGLVANSPANSCARYRTQYYTFGILAWHCQPSDQLCQCRQDLLSICWDTIMELSRYRVRICRVLNLYHVTDHGRYIDKISRPARRHMERPFSSLWEEQRTPREGLLPPLPQKPPPTTFGISSAPTRLQQTDLSALP